MKHIIVLIFCCFHLMPSMAQVKEYVQGLDAFLNGDNDAALIHFNRSMAIYEQTEDTLNETYANLLNHIASALYRQGKPNEAIPMGQRALQLYERLYGKSFISYAEQCVNLATYYYEIGQYGMSVSYENFAIRSYKKQGVDYFSKNGHERLKTMFEQAKSEGIEVKMGFSPNINMREVFDTNVTRQWEKSSDLHYLHKCREIVDRMYNEGDSTSLDYLHAIDSLVLAYIAVNDTAHANAWIEYGGPMKNQLCGEQSVEAARSYYIYAMTAFAQGNMVEANDRADVVLNILNQTKDHDDETYLNAMMLSCSSYLHMGILGTADKMGPRLVEIADSLFGKDSRQYDAARFQYAQCLFRLQKDSPKIIALLRDCLDWRKKHLGDNHPDTVNALIALANFLCENIRTQDANQRFSEAEALYSRFYELQNENVRNNFLGMSLEEQRNYWQLFERYYLELIPRCSLKKQKATKLSPQPSELCYNAALYGKGILLNSEMLMREALRQSKDGQLLSLYEEIAQEKTELMNLLRSPSGTGSNKADNLRNSINRKQQQLAKNVSAFSDYTQRLATDWKDVRQKLGEKEAAIEFVNTNETHQEYTLFYQDDGSFLYIPSGTYLEKRYAAVIITPHTPEPMLLPLFDFNDIGDLYFNGILREEYLSNLLWKPILDYLGQDVTRIYFSASGALHSLPIESLKTWEGDGLVADRVELYRLSSTRSLCMTDKEGGVDAVIYGGLNYDATIQQMSDQNIQYQRNDLTSAPKSGSKDKGQQRESVGLLSYLKGTKQEADDIKAVVQTAKKNVILLDGNKGTEESFKALDGQKKRLIHIGTHGFFDTSDDASSGNLGMGIEDLSMVRSGLYMTGANHTIFGETLPEGMDDGMLTAEEISSLDLRGLDMVTLSACQTALGEVTGEGVFGLQRGFKKAGAQSILMSLWKVDDEATCLLMTEFYRNWIGKKMNKHDALEEAKKAVRSHKDKGWDDPKYWAAFILLDGMD